MLLETLKYTCLTFDRCTCRLGCYWLTLFLPQVYATVCRLNLKTYTATINGTGSCKFEALALATTTVTDVVVPKSKTVAQEWDYPSSGTVNVERPFRTIVVTFSGGNVADALVTNKLNQKTHSFKINLDTGEEYE